MSKTPQVIEKLIEKFDRNLDEYRNPKYNETLIRVEFVNPFWKALGWDVDNEIGHSFRFRDVIHEDEVRVGQTTKAPDYSFRIGGTRVFFVETKKPAVDLKHDPAPAFQLRRYAYSAKLPISILTDFEEFIVYDCKLKPTITDKPHVGRMIYYTFQEYLDQWDKIHKIFSKEAVMQGNLDRFIEKKEGKKARAEIDRDFLNDLDKWRVLLARNIALRNTDLTERELNYAVQLTIDRLIFLRMCEDRGIETRNTLQVLLNGERTYPRLVEIYYQADERYNSGLFHFQKEKDITTLPDKLTPSLKIDDKTLKDVIGELYYPKCPYEFSILPVEVLGNAYEQFLGKVIRLTKGHHAKIEEKPEVRKAGGVYYTPKYIVDYIVKNTVGKLLEDKTPKEVSDLRVLDPACGSGSFLLGAYQYLLEWHLSYYRDEFERTHQIPSMLPAKGQRKRKTDPEVMFQGMGDEWYLTTAEKKRILLNNIYGVDIDANAVEVTKLSLLLKVLENETSETIHSQLKLWHERALPDLSSNIKCGNSLIGPEFYESRQATMFDEEEALRINAFDWSNEFQDIFDKGGFDAVIGNPPYVRIQRIDHKEVDYIYSKYKTPVSKTDLSQIFLERSFELVSKTGWVGFIITSQWLATEYGKKMRNFLSSGILHTLIDFGSLPVFTADTYPAIVFLKHKKVKELNYIKITDKSKLNLKGINDSLKRHVQHSDLDSDPWNLSGFNLLKILEKKNWLPLSEYGKAYIGALTGMDEAFVVNADIIQDENLELELIIPYAYRGSEIERYSQVTPFAKIIYPYEPTEKGVPILIKEKVLKNKYPNIYNHLIQYKTRLIQRKDSRKLYAVDKNWYRFLRPGSFRYISPFKLIVKGIGTRTNVGILEGNTAFNGANCPAIIFKREFEKYKYYILAVLNSKIISYWLKTICPAKLGGYTRFTAKNITKTPIPKIITAKEQRIIKRLDNLVELMIDLHINISKSKSPRTQEQLQRQIEATDRQIDKLVYELYDLNEEEIRIIEKSV